MEVLAVALYMPDATAIIVTVLSQDAPFSIPLRIGWVKASSVLKLAREGNANLSKLMRTVPCMAQFPTSIASEAGALMGRALLELKHELSQSQPRSPGQALLVRMLMVHPPPNRVLTVPVLGAATAIAANFVEVGQWPARIFTPRTS